MDEMKLTAWQELFEAEAQALRIEYDAFFQRKDFKDVYRLELNESDQWMLKMDSQLPNEFKERLEAIFEATRPEDSI